MVAFDRLAHAVGERLDSGFWVPLLVLRLPEFEQIAWRDGRRTARTLERQTISAFGCAARRILRDGDALAHEVGSDRFAVAMLSPARAGRPPESNEVRAALERIAAAMSLSTGRRMQTGWWPVEARAEIESIETTLDAALERGAREREHGEMLATVGHELRTPLTSIRGYIETLLDGELDPSTARRFLETARREALRLGRLVEGMLEFSMLDLSAPRRDARCDVAEQIRATIDATVPLARDRRVTLRARLPQSAPARVDGDACMHALVNLVENGIKCGGENGTVEIACARAGSFVEITVDDDGPGIVASKRESIFQMGTRGDVAGHPGSGIGLAVVKAIADRAGGDVRVLASPLGGARFTLRFPTE
ncbi:MAG TPA: HAMP domain-containing sensor histidine kinase [Candidatus Tumulicola sp.]